MLFSTAVSLVSEKDKNLTSNFSFFVKFFFFFQLCSECKKKRTIASVKVLSIAVHSVTVLSSRKPFPRLTHHTSTSCTSTNQTFPRIHSGQFIHDVTVPLSLCCEEDYILHINTSDDGYFMLLSSVVCSEQQWGTWRKVRRTEVCQASVCV